MVSLLPIKLNSHKTIVILQSKIKFCIKSGVNSSGVIIAPIPKIKNKLRTQEPTKLPTAISVSLRITAKIEVTSILPFQFFFFIRIDYILKFFYDRIRKIYYKQYNQEKAFYLIYILSTIS